MFTQCYWKNTAPHEDFMIVWGTQPLVSQKQRNHTHCGQEQQKQAP